MSPLIIGGAVALAGGVLLLVFQGQYARSSGREIARSMRAYGDSSNEWTGRYRSKARFAGVVLILLGVVGVIAGIASGYAARRGDPGAASSARPTSSLHEGRRGGEPAFCDGAIQARTERQC